jgi:hypothetical protein
LGYSGGLNQAKLDVGLGFETAKNLADAEKAANASFKVFSKLTSAWNLFTDNMALYLTPLFESMNNWFNQNGELIMLNSRQLAQFLTGNKMEETPYNLRPQVIPKFEQNKQYYGPMFMKEFFIDDRYHPTPNIGVSVFVDGKKIPSVANIGIGRNASLDRGMNK